MDKDTTYKTKVIEKISKYFPSYKKDLEENTIFYELLIEYFNINKIPVYLMGIKPSIEDCYGYGNLYPTGDKGTDFKIEEFKKINDLLIKTLITMKNEKPSQYIKYHQGYKRDMETNKPLDTILGRTMGGLKLDGEDVLTNEQKQKTETTFQKLKDKCIRYVCFGQLATEEEIKSHSLRYQK